MLKSIVLQNFRNYSQRQFEFSPQATVIVAPNTFGKSNLIEAIYLLSTGKSFRTDKDLQLIAFGQEVGRVRGKVISSHSGSDLIGAGLSGIDSGVSAKADPQNGEQTELEVMIACGEVTGGRLSKKFLVNKIPKRKLDFTGISPSVLFSPEELNIVTAGPSLRRNFLDHVLLQVDKEYRLAYHQYDAALKQRNALLGSVKDEAASNAVFARSKRARQFEYWDELLIKNGQLITLKRELLLDFVNQALKPIFAFRVCYEKSLISAERLAQYQEAQFATGVTLVGPHRDDFRLEMAAKDGNRQDVRYFGSRGQQRLAVLQLKTLQIDFMQQSLGRRPLLLLDDVFSELDQGHIQLVWEMLGKSQTIITTTHEEFLSSKDLKDAVVVKL